MTLTVIVPTHDRRDLLAQAVASLERQRAALPVPLDILVVDDGSTDGTAAWLGAVERPGLRSVRRPQGGIAAARNTGFDNLPADSRFVTFLDSDDVSPDGALAGLLAPLLGDPGLDYSYGDLLMIDRIDPVRLAPAADAQTRRFTAIQLSCALLRRSLVDRIGRFDPDFVQAEDTDYLLRIFETGAAFRQVDTLCLLYRRHGGNVTTRQAESRRFFAMALARSMRRRRADPARAMRKPAFEVQHIAEVAFH